jgi:hypothetical protein
MDSESELGYINGRVIGAGFCKYDMTTAETDSLEIEMKNEKTEIPLVSLVFGSYMKQLRTCFVSSDVRVFANPMKAQ